MKRSAGMNILIPCVLLLLTSGAEVASQVVNGILGESVSFYESVPIQANPGIQWTFNSAIIAQRFPSGPYACNGDQFAGRCNLFENGTLRLDNLRFADDGNYSMLAQYPDLTVIKRSFYTLRVYNILSTPILSSNVSADRLINGTHVSLHCDAGSQAVTTYTFYRDGKNICAEPHVTCRDSNVFFQPITESDSGSYTCTIQNPISTSTSNTLRLSVSVSVSDVKLTSNISGLAWPGLDPVSLTCSARGTNVSYSWRLQGAPLPQDPQYHFTENNSVLIISPISAKDNGNFTCTASNWINNETSNGVNFILASAVSAVILTSNASGSYIWAGEDSVSFHCSSDGSAVTFLWKLNGELLPRDPRYHISGGDSPPHSNLTISPVSRNDAGHFTCEASNRLGSKTSIALSLNLAFNPEKPISCTVEPVGQNVTLGCSWSGGQPAANVSLIFSGETRIGTDDVTREVSVGGNFRESNFTCLGDQVGRTSQCTVIFVHPEAPGHNNDTITASKVGATVNLTVILQSGLTAEFTWYRLNPGLIPIQTNRKVSVENTGFSSRLQIPDVTVKDAGQYVCTAKNFIGSQSFLFTVDVTETAVSAVTLTSNASGSYIWAGEDSLSFRCSSDGSAVTFLWKLNGESLSRDPRYHISGGDSPPHSSLTISPVSRNDAGPFTCEASNRLGSKTSNALSILNLAFNPEKPINCTVEPVGQNVKLGCSWSGGRPAAKVSLIFGGETQIGTDNVTREVSVGGNFQGSNFTCLGDQVGRTSQCTVTFVHPEAPGHNNDTITASKVGATVNLTVILQSGLTAEFTWYRLNPDLIPIQTNRKVSVENTGFSSRLQIPDVTVKDAGKYVCTAKNFIGSQSFLFTVDVTESGLSGGAIAGIVIGVLAGVALIGIAVFFIMKKKKRSGDNKRINDPQDQLGQRTQ